MTRVEELSSRKSFIGMEKIPGKEGEWVVVLNMESTLGTLLEKNGGGWYAGEEGFQTLPQCVRAIRLIRPKPKK